MLLHAKNSPIPNPNAHIIQRRLSSSSSRVCSSTSQNIVEWISSVTSDPCESRVNIETNAFGVRGLVSQKQLSPGEVIFEIPFRYCFQDDYENESSLSWSARMGMKLLEERAKGEKSEKYEKWIESLPVQAPFLPGLAMTEEEIQRLIRYPPCVMNALKDKERHEESKRLLNERLANIGCSEADLDWAAGLMESRCFKQGGVRVTAPGIDLCNHAGDKANCIVRFVSEVPKDNDDLAKKETKMKLQVSPDRFKPIEKGEEITISYGYQSNDIYFSYFGFVPFDNDNDTAVLFESVEDLSEFLKLAGEEIQSDLCRNETTDNLAARILSSTSSSSSSQSFSIAANGKIESNLSKAFDACELNQSQRAIVIQKRCHEILTNGPFVGTTVREDLRIAESEEEEEKHRVCARYRVAKKEIYAFPLKKKC